MSGSDIFLAVRDIWKTYAVPHGGGSRPVLQGLDFCLERGEMAGLVGESGSGKSTLARLLLGLERPDRGTVLLEGQPLRQWRAGGGRLSVVFQDYVTSVDPGFTLAEAVDEGLGPGCRLSRRERRREVTGCWSAWGFPLHCPVACRMSSAAARCSGPASRGRWPRDRPFWCWTRL